jgi:cytidylate kinase
MFNSINIAIDGQAATGKTSIGSELAKMLNYKFIDTGLFYRYFAFKFINHNVDNLSEEIVKSEITIDDLEQINLNISNQYLQIGARASEISKNDDVRSAINDLIK